jgi:hypothetical protein
LLQEHYAAAASVPDKALKATVSRVEAVVDELTAGTTKSLTATTSLTAVVEKALNATASRVEPVADKLTSEAAPTDGKALKATVSCVEEAVKKALKATSTRFREVEGPSAETTAAA